ncbi:hypothetical protein EUGRSUZ_B00484 [Eucalyptus grandis]|uniref:Uncharacterized protein n=2 Tax=Eucalyptus grandis TaxID=71139 RepID=A0ACC3LPC7_EUCGR|nr:hypothetical protein EUGRSUZ_B00484 [Eucalyptus grandis]
MTSPCVEIPIFEIFLLLLQERNIILTRLSRALLKAMTKKSEDMPIFILFEPLENSMEKKKTYIRDFILSC